MSCLTLKTVLCLGRPEPPVALILSVLLVVGLLSLKPILANLGEMKLTGDFALDALLSMMPSKYL